MKCQFFFYYSIIFYSHVQRKYDSSNSLKYKRIFFLSLKASKFMEVLNKVTSFCWNLRFNNLSHFYPFFKIIVNVASDLTYSFKTSKNSFHAVLALLQILLYSIKWKNISLSFNLYWFLGMNGMYWCLYWLSSFISEHVRHFEWHEKGEFEWRTSYLTYCISIMHYFIIQLLFFI